MANNNWRYEYCGHSQFVESRKCADCGGPRPDFDKPNSYWSTVSTDLEIASALYRGTFAGQRELINERILDIQADIGEAFIPVLIRMANWSINGK